MFPTIIFFIALILSITFTYRTINGIVNNVKMDNSDLLYMVAIPFFWSLLFYLLH